MKSLSGVIFSVCFFSHLSVAQDAHVPNVGEQAPGASTTPSFRVTPLPCPWQQSAPKISIHFVRVTTQEESNKRVSAIMDHIGKDGKKATKLVIMPAGPATKAPRPKNSPEIEIYGTASELMAYLTIQAQFGILKKVIEINEFNKDASKIKLDTFSRGGSMRQLINIGVGKMMEAAFARILLGSLAERPEIRDVWNSFPRPLGDKDAERLATEVFDKVAAYDFKAEEKEYVALAKKLSENPGAANLIFAKFFQHIGKLIDERNAKKNLPPANLEKAIETAFSGEDKDGSLTKAMQQVRLYEFFEAIGPVLCKTKKKNLPIHIVAPGEFGLDVKATAEAMGGLMDAEGKPVPYTIVD